MCSLFRSTLLPKVFLNSVLVNCYSYIRFFFSVFSAFFSASSPENMYLRVYVQMAKIVLTSVGCGEGRDRMGRRALKIAFGASEGLG